MSASKHTLGPWRVSTYTAGRVVEIEAGDSKDFGAKGSYRHITNALPMFPMGDEDRNTETGNSIEMEANARLIAAAPSLLEAAKAALGVLETLHYTDAQRQLVAAIAEAEAPESEGGRYAEDGKGESSL